jgi:hypothetical protein
VKAQSRGLLVIELSATKAHGLTVIEVTSSLPGRDGTVIKTYSCHDGRLNSGQLLDLQSLVFNEVGRAAFQWMGVQLELLSRPM